MTNRFLTAIEDIGKVIEWPFVHLARAYSILTVALKDWPALRTALTGLLQQVETTATAVETAAAANELNPAADAAEIVAAVTLYRYAKNTFLPAVEQAYKDELTAGAATANAAALAAAKRSAAAIKANATRQAASSQPASPAASRAANVTT
jgi:hypothetical protein